MSNERNLTKKDGLKFISAKEIAGNASRINEEHARKYEQLRELHKRRESYFSESYLKSRILQIERTAEAKFWEDMKRM